jgi:hypothetical protein
MEYIGVLLVIVLVILLLTIRFVVNKRLKEIEKDLLKNNTVLMFLLKIEEHNNMLYLYNTGTDMFVSQGKSLHELSKNVYEYKKIELAMVSYNKNLLYFLNGKVYKFVDKEMIEVAE